MKHEIFFQKRTAWKSVGKKNIHESNIRKWIEVFSVFKFYLQICKLFFPEISIRQDIFMEKKLLVCFFSIQNLERKVHFVELTIVKTFLGLEIFRNFKAMWSRIAVYLCDYLVPKSNALNSRSSKSNLKSK